MALADYLVLAVVAILLFFAIRHILRKKGSGCGGCSGCCQTCARHAPDNDATKSQCVKRH